MGERSGMLRIGAIGGASRSCVLTSFLPRCGFIVSGLGTEILDSPSDLSTVETETTLIGLTGDGGEVGE